MVLDEVETLQRMRTDTCEKGLKAHRLSQLHSNPGAAVAWAQAISA